MEKAKRVVFAVLVSWRRKPSTYTAADDERRPTLEEEYNKLMKRLPKGSVLYMGRNSLSEIQYDAVVVLRGSLATEEDVRNWMNTIQGFEVQPVREPAKGEELEEFFGWTQAYCGRIGASVYGPELSLAYGDTETQRYLDGLSGRLRYEDGAAERLTQDMRRYQKSCLSKELFQ